MVLLVKNLKNASLAPLGYSKQPPKSKMAAKIEEVCCFCIVLFFKQVALRKMIFYVQKKVKLKFWSIIAIRKLKMAAKFQNGRQKKIQLAKSKGN